MKTLERIAEELPPGYVVSVQVERGAAWVDLVRNGIPVELEQSSDLTLAGQMLV